MKQLDFLLVGGGLQNALIASALAHHQPRARVAIVEAESRVGGNHVWCFHAEDVSLEAAPFVEPFVVRRWPKYRVHFPTYARTLEDSYAAVTSNALHDALVGLSGRTRVELMLGTAARCVEPYRVELESGDLLEARWVIDARGPERFARTEAIGYQKFIGLELEVSPESAPSEPTLMDCTIEQRDGLRFFYVLPLAERRVLVEDTYFSDHPELDERVIEAEILRYAEHRGLVVKGIARKERGVLPLPSRAPVAVSSRSGLVHAGYQGGWFHPTTGYSFPLAVRLATLIATATEGELPLRLSELITRTARQQRFAVLLNRMLFLAFAPELRRAVFERFYRLPPDTVRRFYALSLSGTDRARIVCGRPPRGLSARGLLSAVRDRRVVFNPQPETNP
ncbi:MAG TPA: lycopene beta-cyclase CrtY [Polyangiaceae bacterium]|nr:lycopene beta-cyclase CrtY [Polyangiaceae bacterium]